MYRKFDLITEVVRFYNQRIKMINLVIPDKVRLEKSVSNMLPDACKNSQKSAVVGGGDGESKVKEHGDGKQLDDAGLRLEQGVPTS